MSDRLFLAPHVQAVGVNGDLVFLDVEQDAYVCLPDGARDAPLDASRRVLTTSDRELTRDLLAAGLASAAAPSGAQDRSAVRTPASPTASALRDQYDFPTWPDAVQMVRATADMLGAYRGRSFGEIVAAARVVREHPPVLSTRLVTVVDAFHRWAPFAPMEAKCLLRAFMLLRLLRRHGEDALWVFGVRTWPFHAHCWLQCEGLVLDDEPDRIRAFTPIMVL